MAEVFARAVDLALETIDKRNRRIAELEAALKSAYGLLPAEDSLVYALSSEARDIVRIVKAALAVKP